MFRADGSYAFNELIERRAADRRDHPERKLEERAERDKLLLNRGWRAQVSERMSDDDAIDAEAARRTHEQQTVLRARMSGGEREIER